MGTTDVLNRSIHHTHEGLTERLEAARAMGVPATEPRLGYERIDTFLASASKHLHAVDAVLLPPARRQLPDGGDVRMSKRLRERVAVVGPRQSTPEELVAAADVVCVASGGSSAAPGLIRTGLGSGAVPVASHLPIYEELTADGELGLLFPPGDTLTLSGQLSRLAGDRALLDRLRSAGGEAVRDWGAVTDQVEAIHASCWFAGARS